MNKKEMAEAMLAGKILEQPNGAIAYYDDNETYPFRYKAPKKESVQLNGAWDWNGWKIKEEQKMRYMTPDEVQVFILYHPHILVRVKNEHIETRWMLPQSEKFIDDGWTEYIEVSEDGTRSEPKRLMVEDK